jgi:hypothetical protein
MHLTLNQGAAGSIPAWPTIASWRNLADALGLGPRDLGSSPSEAITYLHLAQQAEAQS